ncbi:hypothetical protein T484DRAFT_1825324, partial [Baffinella frigidus]
MRSVGLAQEVYLLQGISTSSSAPAAVLTTAFRAVRADLCLTSDSSIVQQDHQFPPFKPGVSSAEALHTPMARTKLSDRLAREARLAEASRIAEEGSDEEAPVRKRSSASEGRGDEDDGDVAMRSEGGDDGGGSGERQDEEGWRDIEMGDENEWGCAEEAEHPPTLPDQGELTAPRKSKRVAPEIELPTAVNKKQKKNVSWAEGIEGPP